MEPKIVLDDMGRNYHIHFDRRVFVKVDGQKYRYSFELSSLVSDHSMMNEDALEFAECFGFIYPPATAYQDIYLIPPATFFEIRDSQVFLGDLIDAITELNEEMSQEDFQLYLEHLLYGEIKDALRGNDDVHCLFSAGIDSSVLLGILKKHVQVKGLMCDMPSMPSEKAKALSMSAQGGFELDIVALRRDLKSHVDSAVGLIQEPIYDNAAILLLALLSESKINKEKAVIIDGQGADSLFFGLPHNRVFNLYERYSFLLSKLKFMNFLPKFSRRDSPLNRFFYRVIRALDLLLSASEAEFLIKSLVLPGKEVRAFKENKTFSGMNEDIIKLVTQFSKDKQSAIRALFMLRVLPARELQKYDVLKRAGYNVSLPYMQECMVLKMFAYSSACYIVNGIYKYPIFQICKNLWPGYFESFSTSPFYHEFSSGEETNILGYTIEKARSVGVRRDL